MSIPHEEINVPDIQEDTAERNTRYKGLLRHSREANELAKECLKSALVKLAREKAYKEITVSELCRTAGFSRMAFYRNYTIIDDIFHELATDMNTMVVNTVGSPFRIKTTREWYVCAFRLIAENRDAMELMFQENFQREWMDTVNSFVVHDPDFSGEEKYRRLMWSGGFENTVSYWLNTGMKESPEELADYCITYLPHLSHADAALLD